MTRVTLLASDLGANGGAALAAAIAAHPRGLYAPTLVALSAPPSTATAYLRRLGVPVTLAPIRGPFDIAGILALRRAVVESRPDVTHYVGTRVLRFTSILPLTKRCVVSHTTGAGGKFVRRFDEYAVLPSDGAVADLTRLGVPPGGRAIVAASDFGPDSGLREAVWAFDIVRHVAPDAHLVLLGDGPGRRGVERFARSLAPTDCRVHFAGRVADAPAILRAADCVWLTARRGGVTFALESLAARSPVLAYDGPATRFAQIGSGAVARDPVTLARLTVEWSRGELPLPTGYSPLAAAAGPEAVASRAASVYTA